jgi:hypothetical protein
MPFSMSKVSAPSDIDVLSVEIGGKPIDLLRASRSRYEEGKQVAVVILITNGGRVQASYSGGEYIEVAFGSAHNPTDVINVFDYEAGKPRIANNVKAVEKVFVRWLCANNPGIIIFETRLLA